MYRTTRPEDLAVLVIKAALERAPGLDPAEVDDLIMGCAFPEAEQGLNVGRNAWLQAGLPIEVPGVTVNRFCSSGAAGHRLRRAGRSCRGMAEVMMAGGRRVDVAGAGRRQQAHVRRGAAWTPAPTST